MKIEAGGKYRTRAGIVVDIVGKHSGYWSSSDDLVRNDRGSVMLGWDSPFDIVERIDAPEPTTQGRRHVSDDARACLVGALGNDRAMCALQMLRGTGTVLLTVAEVEAMERVNRTTATDLLAAWKERDELRAEVERLKEERDYWKNDRDVLEQIVSRLRKGAGDERNEMGLANPDSGSGSSVHRASGGVLLAAGVGYDLNPRLGLPQPDGEPGTVTQYWKRSIAPR